ncbi:hypothetical protein HZS_4539, partial [Henneguya salminicola]
MQMNQHSHESSKGNGGIKRSATTITEIPSVILNGALQQTSTAVKAKMPNKDAFRKVIQRRQSNSEWSHLLEKLYVDGTFSLAPALFSQIYVIMAAREEFVLPVFYSNNVSELCYPWMPFLFKKELRRKLADEGLLRKYNTNHDFAFAARMIVALSFVPIEDIDLAFKALENEIVEHLTPILNRFEEVYIGRQNRNWTRRSALLPPHIWSVYERT